MANESTRSARYLFEQSAPCRVYRLKHSKHTPYGDSVFIGTCFPYRHRSVLLTAAHVIRGLAADEIAVLVPGSFVNVPKVHVHPTADIAIMEILMFASAGIIFPFWAESSWVSPWRRIHGARLSRGSYADCRSRTASSISRAHTAVLGLPEPIRVSLLGS